MSKEEIPKRLRVLFALNRVDPTLRNDLLEDGTLLAQFSIPAERPMQLWGDVTVSQEVLFAAFADATEQSEVKLEVKGTNGPVTLTITIVDEAAKIRDGNRGIRIAYAGLLAKTAPRRLKALNYILSELSVSESTKRSLESQIASASWDHNQFLKAARALDAAPESFSRSLRERVQKGGLQSADMLPEDWQYWGFLIPDATTSHTLKDFVSHELLVEWTARLNAVFLKTFNLIAASFVTPALVPHGTLSSIADELLIQALDELSLEQDHFTLVGAFEICAKKASTDSRYVAVGTKILDRLFGDVESLLTRVSLFGAVFILTTARLSTSTATRDKPAFWRRLVAATHAGLVVRVCEISTFDRKKVLNLATAQCGREYLLSCLLDMRTEPRWDPEWASPDYLVADAFGRVDAAAKGVPGGTPKEWQEPIEKMGQWIVENHHALKVFYPAILEGALEQRPETLDEKFRNVVVEDITDLRQQTKRLTVLRMHSWVHISGIRPELPEVLHSAIGRMRSGSEELDEETRDDLLSIGTTVAMLGKDQRLSQLIADAYVDRSPATTEPQQVVEAVLRLVQLSAAYEDKKTGFDNLVSSIRRLANRLPMGAVSEELVELISRLQRLDEGLAMQLATASHIARLAMRPPLAV